MRLPTSPSGPRPCSQGSQSRRCELLAAPALVEEARIKPVSAPYLFRDGDRDSGLSSRPDFFISRWPFPPRPPPFEGKRRGAFCTVSLERHRGDDDNDVVEDNDEEVDNVDGAPPPQSGAS